MIRLESWVTGESTQTVQVLDPQNAECDFHVIDIDWMKVYEGYPDVRDKKMPRPQYWQERQRQCSLPRTTNRNRNYDYKISPFQSRKYPRISKNPSELKCKNKQWHGPFPYYCNFNFSLPTRLPTKRPWNDARVILWTSQCLNDPERWKWVAPLPMYPSLYYSECTAPPWHKNADVSHRSNRQIS